MTYYHATTKDRIESIRRHGLGGLRGAPKAFPDCEDGVYLAADPIYAMSFLVERALAGEFAHLTPLETYALFSVFVIDGSRVDPARLEPDPNTPHDGFWLYRGVIDVNAMPVVDAYAVLA